MAKYDEKDIKFTKLFIDGDFRDSKTGKYYELYDLLKDKAWVKVTEGDKTDVEFAVTAAYRAFDYGSEWRKLEVAQRSRLLYNLAELLQRDFDYLTWLETRNTGKTLEDSKFDLKRSIDFLRYYAGYNDKFSRTDRDKNEYFEFSSKEPLGVIGLLADHIDPLWTFIRHIVPVLATGNTLVYKPSYKTPLTTLYIAYLIQEVGFPHGVVNIVTGKGTNVGQAFGLNEYIKHITFTGRREIGKLFYDYAGQSNLKTLKLYFTEKSPLFVFDDANIDDAALIAHHAAFFKDGKTRYRPVRIFVQENIYDKFVKRSLELVQKRRLGDLFDKDVRVGSFINEDYYKRFLNYIETAKKDGAKLEYGGKRFGNNGWYVEPTILTNVVDDNKYLLDYDLYGPIELITRFKRIEDIPDYLRKWQYDRTIGVVSKDFNRFKELERRLDISVFWLVYFKLINHEKVSFRLDRESENFFLLKIII